MKTKHDELPTKEELIKMLTQNNKYECIVFMLGSVLNSIWFCFLITATTRNNAFLLLFCIGALHMLMFLKTLDDLKEDNEKLKKMLDNHEYRD